MVHWQPDAVNWNNTLIITSVISYFTQCMVWPDWGCVCVEAGWKYIGKIVTSVTTEATSRYLISDRVGWMQAWPEEGLHPLSCLHGHMCCFTDSPLAHPNNTSPPTSEPFSPPSSVTASVWMWWGLFSSTLTDSSRLLAVFQPTGRHQGVASGHGGKT